MRFLFLNQYGPPDTPPTARLLGEFADFLRGRGHDVEILSQSQSYQGRPARGGGRLRRELSALLFILRTGWQRRAPRPEVILALSSPPGLLVVAALLAWRHGARLAHWAMDLYPELAVALGEVPPGVIAKLLQTAMNRAYRRAAVVIALDEDMRDHLQPRCRSVVQVLAPWPAHAIEQPSAELAANHPVAAPPPPWIWLYSGNLGRAHEWQTLLDAQRLLEDRRLPIRLVFQGDGAARAAAMSYAAELGLQRCEWKDYVAESDLLPTLLHARVLIVTQRPETRGLLWPSKLAVLEKLPRPILFIGPTDGAIARRLQVRGDAGVFSPTQAAETAHWIEDQFTLGTGVAASSEFDPAAPKGCAILERWLVELS